MAARKLSRVSLSEMGVLDDSLKALFDACATDGQIDQTGLIQFAESSKLLNAKLTNKDVGMIYSSTKLGGKQTLSFERFQEAIRKMAAKRQTTYQELVQIACGNEPESETVSTPAVAAWGASPAAWGTSANSSTPGAKPAAVGWGTKIETPAAGGTGAAGGMSASDAKSVIGGSGGIGSKAKMFVPKTQTDANKHGIRSGIADIRAAKFGGGKKAAGPTGSANGFSAANAAKEIGSGSLKNKLAAFGQVDQGVNKDFSAYHAQKTVGAGHVTNRAAAFGGAAPLKAGSNDAFSAANAAQEIGSGAVSNRAAAFGGGAAAIAGKEDGFSAANAAKEIGSGSVAARASAFQS
jgi:hypothetical protein